MVPRASWTHEAVRPLKTCEIVFVLGIAGAPTFALLDACSKQTGAPSQSAKTSASYTEIDWEQLIPADELENHRLAVAFAMRRIDHSTDQRAPQLGSFKTVQALDGQSVSLAGYIVPLESDDQGRMTDFFLVPTIGACIHVPPPPPDQMVYVHLGQPVPTPEAGQAATVEGVLHTAKHDDALASAAYSMESPLLTPKNAP
jgi:hypothetical protein